MTHPLSTELQKLLPELEGLRSKAQGKLSKDEYEALEKPTENILIKPFLRIFGYNTESITAPNRAEAEYKIGTKRVDFALFKNNVLVIVVEAKRIGADLSRCHQQLSDYFNTTEKNKIPKFGVLTNGEEYKIYASSENRMDTNPCFEFNLGMDYDTETKLQKLSEILFDINEEVAKTQKIYTNTRDFIEEILKNPTEDFLKEGILKIADSKGIRLYEGKVITKTDIENIKPVAIQVFKDIVDSEVNKQFDSMKRRNDTNSATASSEAKTTFTKEEQEGLLIIRAIASEVIDPSRVQYKDYQGFCNINLDGKVEKNRICELHFNDIQNLRLHIKGNMIGLLSVSDIYKHKEEVLDVIKGVVG